MFSSSVLNFSTLYLNIINIFFVLVSNELYWFFNLISNKQHWQLPVLEDIMLVDSLNLWENFKEKFIIINNSLLYIFNHIFVEVVS